MENFRSPVRRRETNQRLRKVVEWGHYICVPIEPQQQDLVGTKVPALLEDSLQIHFATRARSDRKPATDAREEVEQVVYTVFGRLPYNASTMQIPNICC